MHYVLVLLFTAITVTHLIQYVRIIGLLIKLGVKWTIIQFLLVATLMVGGGVALVVGNDFSNTGLVLGILLSASALPAMFETTRKKPKSGYGKKRPKSVSDTDYAWSYYGGSTSSDCGDTSSGYGGDSCGDGGGSD